MNLLIKSLLVAGVLFLSSYGTYRTIDMSRSNGLSHQSKESVQPTELSQERSSDFSMNLMKGTDTYQSSSTIIQQSDESADQSLEKAGDSKPTPLENPTADASDLSQLQGDQESRGKDPEVVSSPSITSESSKLSNNSQVSDGAIEVVIAQDSSDLSLSTSHNLQDVSDISSTIEEQSKSLEPYSSTSQSAVDTISEPISGTTGTDSGTAN